MSARKWVVAAFATTLLTTGLVVGPASSAFAAPTDCSYQLNTVERWASSYCSSGTGEHRIHVLQKHFLAEVGYIPIEGPWVPAGQTSWTSITAHTVVNVWIETRG
ncbi:hypothetical protein [Planotetraspora sp. GP83]|uniref:hypothetical protein n=1 Tax=Planotetraspora sp. GP83 TaxID=3156264 RepID=UPI0035156962